MLSAFLPVPSHQTFAQSLDPAVVAYLEEMTVRRELLIVGSSPSYAAARKHADVAARRLGIPLRLRGLAPHSQTGLTWSKSECEENGSDHPCYLARGRFDDGVYVSIEYSSAYEELRPDLYIVVIANGPAGDRDLAEARRKAAPLFPDLYTRSVAVYMGCMH